MADSFGLVILAAGQGTRLKLNIPKPLAPIMGKKLVDFPVKASLSFLEKNGLGFLGFVTGFGKDEVENYIKDSYSSQDNFRFAFQEKQLGTGDALRSYFQKIPEASAQTYTIVLCADVPVMEDSDIQKLYNFVKENNLEGAAATFKEDKPFGYGRVIRGKKGFKIVEEKEASEEEQKVDEVNSGFYVLKTKYILKYIDSLSSNNKSGEFYLTDLFSQGENIEPLLFEEGSRFIGVNDLRQLEIADRTIRGRKMKYLRDEIGVRFIDINHTYVEEDVSMEMGVLLYPNSFITGKTIIKEGATVETGCIIKDSVVEEDVEIKAYSHLEKVIIRKKAVIGPYARLREGSDIGSESKIGNFVETKKAVLSKGVKVSHLSYVGDAEIGEDSNIGCGFITCNYDGINKHKTKIGKGCFIGSDSQMIAPLNIGDECYIASGSTISKDLPTGAFGIGRARQEIKEGMAKKFIKKKS